MTPSVSVTGRLNRRLLRSALVASLGGLLFGFDTAVISGTTRALTTVYSLSAAMLGFTVASALWGTVVGSLFSGKPTDRYGRRACLRALAGLYLFSALGCAFAWNWPSLLFFRFICGLAIGGSSVIGPMYIAEIAPADKRGRLVGMFQFNIVVGVLIAYLSNYLVSLASLGPEEWRWKLGVAAIPAAAFFIALRNIPQSPRWLVREGHIEEARDVLKEIGEPDVEAALREIGQTVKAHGAPAEKLFTRRYMKPILLAVSIGIFNQFTGINAILYYLNDIFEFAGFSKISADQQAVTIGFANLLSTALAMSVIDRLGRRKLLLTGAAGTGFCLAGVAVIFATKQHQDLLLWLLVGFIVFFAFSQGAVIWVYLSEVFPNMVRAQGQSLGSFTHWIMNAMISAIYPVVAASSGAAPFAFFAVMMVVQFFVVLFLYPETSGVTLERMELRLGADKT
ncbi:MAG TPA: sugar porter family MFS transporter [Bryobacteraceae bacterium]|nr:sugar porter family MFS transporter [Bryobacteraceae bacterium]